VKGNKLKYGDTIGIIMPASPQENCIIDKHISNLINMGFSVKKGAHIYDKHGYLAGMDEDRARDLMDMFLDKDVDAIMCYRGGYGTMRILSYIDKDIIKQHPKIFIGYSDITSLLNFFTLKCNLITFHGPMVSSNFGDTATTNSFLSTLMFGTEPYIINNSKDREEKYYGNSSAEGILVGGNLSLICSTIGTPYEITTKNKILFIEEVGENPYRVDRMLTQLLLCEKLQKCQGFILGQFTDCSSNSPEKSLTLHDVLQDRILSLSKPTVINFMAGHSYPNLTLPIGAIVRINPQYEHVEVLESVVKD
jgi:muramoyltetrapeptide carboxypeptidase